MYLERKKNGGANILRKKKTPIIRHNEIKYQEATSSKKRFLAYIQRWELRVKAKPKRKILKTS